MPAAGSQLCGSLRARSELAQAVKGLPLELAATLLFDTEPLADLLVTLSRASAQAVATHQHLAVALGHVHAGLRAGPPLKQLALCRSSASSRNAHSDPDHRGSHTRERPGHDKGTTMISKRLKQLVLGGAALAALAFGASASAGAAASTGSSSSAAVATNATVRGGSVGAMNHVRDGWIHDLYLTDHEHYLRHHERLGSAP